MLAILEHRPSPNKVELDVLAGWQHICSLPRTFCDHGLAYEEVFSQAPSKVIKEAVQVLVAKAEESSSSSLGLQQINLALKQIKLDALCAPVTPTVTPDLPAAPTDSPMDCDQGDFPFPPTPPAPPAAAPATVDERLFVASITIELIRQHIRGTMGAGVMEDPPALSSPPILPYLTSAPAPAAMSCDDLEKHNTILKTLLQQTSQCKDSSSSFLSKLTNHKSYLILAIPLSADLQAIKRAYKALAIKAHPDKKGGSKEAFQILQTAYQDVLRKHKEQEIEDKAMSKMGKEGRKAHFKRTHAEADEEEATAEEKAADTDDENVDTTNRPPPPPAPSASSGPSKQKPSPASKPVPAPVSTEDEDEDDEDKLSDGLSADGLSGSKTEKPRIFKGRTPPTAPTLTSTSIPEFVPTHANDINHAEEIRVYLEKLIHMVNGKVSFCTNYLQKIIKISKHFSKKVKLAPLTTTYATGSDTSNATNLSVMHAELSQLVSKSISDEIESIADITQTLCTVAMSLVSKAGSHIESAIPQSQFVECVEDCMAKSLQALRTIVSLVTATEQLSKTHQHLTNLCAGKLSNNNEIMHLLSEMVFSAVANYVSTVSNSVEVVLQIASCLHKLKTEVDKLVSTAKELYITDIKQQSTVDVEDEYSEEDRAALRAARTAVPTAPPAAAPPAAKPKPSKPMDALDELKDKIHQLQVELYNQNVSALQRCHADLLTIQTSLYQETLTLPPQAQPAPAQTEALISLLAEVLDADLLTLRAFLTTADLHKACDVFHWMRLVSPDGVDHGKVCHAIRAHISAAFGLPVEDYYPPSAIAHPMDYRSRLFMLASLCSAPALQALSVELVNKVKEIVEEIEDSNRDSMEIGE